MNTNPRDSGVSLDSFFDRCKLPPSAREQCDDFAKSTCSDPIRPVPFQGYCSYTLFAGDETVIQFRPAVHTIDLDIATAACQVFGDLAPQTCMLGELQELGLKVYSLKRIPGISISDLRAQVRSPDSTSSHRERVVRDFAQFQACAWRHSKRGEELRDKRLVGSSLRWRLELMEPVLPRRLRPLVKATLGNLRGIESLPWTLSHGDLIPANVMVSPDSGELIGLLDWAEAEFLPFGVGMYGLEELLGEDVQGCFTYFPEANHLRSIYWSELLSAIPGLAQNPKQLAVVRRAQVLGILLWHGIAFDDGALNRACQEGRDDDEIAKLDAFLLGSLGLNLRGWTSLRSFSQSTFDFFRGFWTR